VFFEKYPTWKRKDWNLQNHNIYPLLYGCKTWSLTLRGELRLRVLDTAYPIDGEVNLLGTHKSNVENPMAIVKSHALHSFTLHMHHVEREKRIRRCRAHSDVT
jgi:hypothetical protein